MTNAGTSEETPLLPAGRDYGHLEDIPISNLVLALYDLINNRVDTSLTYEQLRAPQVNSFLIKPLLQECMKLNSTGTIYALLANMIQFNKEKRTRMSLVGVLTTRSSVCELLASKMFVAYNEAELLEALTYDFYPLKGSNTPRRSTTGLNRISALEVGIQADAKHFMSHPLIVQIIEEMWSGAIIYQSPLDKLHRSHILDNESSYLAIIHGMRGPAVRYRYEDASILKLSRLRVPQYRYVMKSVTLLVLVLLYFAVLKQDKSQVSVVEITFWVWCFTCMLDEMIAFGDTGISFFVMSLWKWLDLGVFLVLLVYGVLRVCGLAVQQQELSKKLTAKAYDCLATTAIFLLPRAFSILDRYPVYSQILISLRRMSIDMVVVMTLIIVFSSGFWISLSMSFSRNVFSGQTAAYHLMQVFFGFTPAVWDNWDEYSYLGRTVLLFYLFMTHFLIVTILVTVLTNSFAAISANASEEHQYLLALNTISLMKADYANLFTYVPPFNLVEWMLHPLYYCLPLRQFVLFNRTIIKITHSGILLIIFLYERSRLKDEKTLTSHSNKSFVDLAGLNSRDYNNSLDIHSRRRANLNKIQKKSQVSDKVNPSPILGNFKKSEGGASGRSILKAGVMDEVFKRPDMGTLRPSRQNYDNSGSKHKRQVQVCSPHDSIVSRQPDTVHRRLSRSSDVAGTSQMNAISDPEDYYREEILRPPTVRLRSGDAYDGEVESLGDDLSTASSRGRLLKSDQKEGSNQSLQHKLSHTRSRSEADILSELADRLPDDAPSISIASTAAASVKKSLSGPEIGISDYDDHLKARLDRLERSMHSIEALLESMSDLMTKNNQETMRSRSEAIFRLNSSDDSSVERPLN